MGTRRHALVVGTALAALVLGLLADTASAALPTRLPAYFFNRLVRAEAIVKDAGTTHDYRLDRGTLRDKTPTSLTLRERDGTTTTIAVAPGADIRLNGRPVAVAVLRRGSPVLTVRDGDAGATLVRAGTAGQGGLAAFFFGPKLVRAEVILRDDGVVHDYRVDQGVIRGKTQDSLMLRERDDTTSTIAVAPGADVRLNGGPAPLSALRRGMLALTVRDGDAAATTVRAAGR